jgi:hypothetical protein
MKSLFLILVLLASTLFSVQGQNKTTYDAILGINDVLEQYRAVDSDTVSANKTTFTYTVFNEGQSSTKESFTNRWEIALDSVSGTPADVSIAYQRRENIFTTWVTDSTQTFTGSVSDTTLVYYDTSAKPDPYRRVKVTYGDGFVIKIDWLSGLFLLE